MITAIKRYREPDTYYGLSTDTKPTDAWNGDEFVEMDTSKLYLFDQESGEWLEVGGS